MHCSIIRLLEADLGLVELLTQDLLFHLKLLGNLLVLLVDGFLLFYSLLPLVTHMLSVLVFLDFPSNLCLLF